MWLRMIRCAPRRAARTTRASCPSGRRTGTCAPRCRSRAGPPRPSTARAWSSPGRSGGCVAQRASPLWREDDVEVVDVVEDRALARAAAGRCRRGCRPSSRRAASGPVAKSSQAARNSRLSCARSAASLRCQAGSTLKNVNLANVRSAIALILAALALLRPPRRAPRRPLQTRGPLRTSRTVVDRDACPSDTTIAALAGVEGLSPGSLSSGIGGGVGRPRRPTSTSARATGCSTTSTTRTCRRCC